MRLLHGSRRQGTGCGWIRVWVIGSLAAMLLATLGATAWAAEAPASSATVEMSGVVVLRVRDAGGWASVYARAEEIYRRINEAINQLQDNISADLVHVGRAGSLPAVFLGEHLIVTVDPASAASNGTSPDRLARMWAANLQRAVGQFVAIHAPQVPPVF